MDDIVSSILLPENIDDFLNFSPSPLPQKIFEDEFDQSASFLIQNDTVVTSKIPKRKSIVSNDECGEVDHDKRKKIKHRNFEKQRRQEMAALNRSLKSLMPLEYLKGRSVADHMLGVVSYIKQMQKTVQRLSEKRDKLRKSLNQEAISCFSSYLLNSTDDNIKIEASKTGFQVIISTDTSGGVTLSRVLDVLNKESLIVRNSISTIANGNMVHIIESQVDEGMQINPSELQNKLRDLIF